MVSCGNNVDDLGEFACDISGDARTCGAVFGVGDYERKIMFAAQFRNQLHNGLATSGADDIADKHHLHANLRSILCCLIFGSSRYSAYHASPS